MSLRIWLAAAAILLIGGARPAWAQGTASISDHTIRGSVIGNDGVAVSGAIVRLLNSAGVILRQASTSENGTFTLQGVDEGKYVLLAQSGKQMSAPRPFRHGQQSEMTLRLGGGAQQDGWLAMAGKREKVVVEAIDRQIVDLREKLAALQNQIEDLAEARDRLVADDLVADDRLIASAEPLPAAAAVTSPPAPSGPAFASPAAAKPQQASPQEQEEEAPSLPGRGQTQKGLYQGLAAGPPEQRYGRGVFSDILQIGGYGSFRYEANNIDLGPQVRDLPQLKRGHNAFDFRRFVFTMDAAPFKKLRFYTEIEFERLNEIEIERNAIPENRGRAARDRRGTRFIQEVEGTSAGEIAMEQAWAEYSFTDNFAARMGVILPPVGRFNILHDDDYWDIPRRPLVDRGGPVLPTKSAWREMGAGVVFNKPVGDGYVDGQFYVVNGVQLDFTIEEVVSLREGRNLLELEPEIAFSSGAFDGSQTSDAVTWRVALSPSLGQEIAVSGYHGEYTPDYLIEDAWVNTLALDGKATLGNFEIEGEFVYTKFNSFRNVLGDMSLQMVDAIAKTESSETASLESEVETGFSGPFTDSRKGFWVDFKYRSRPKWLQESFLGDGFEDPQLIPIVRWERIWFDDFLTGIDFTNSQVTSLNTEDLQQERVTVGLAYRPATPVVFTLAWEHNRRVEGSQLIFPQPVGTDPLFDNSFDTLIVGTAFGF